MDITPDQGTVFGGVAALVAIPLSVAAIVISLLSWRATKRQADVMAREDHRARTPSVELVIPRKVKRPYMRIPLDVVLRDGGDVDSCRVELLHPEPGETQTPGFEVVVGERFDGRVEVGRLRSNVPVRLQHDLTVRREHFQRDAVFRLRLQRGDEVWDDVVVSVKLPRDPQARMVIAR